MGKKILLSILALTVAIIALLPSKKAYADSYKPGVYRINTQEDPLNVRSGPDIHNLWVGTVPKDALVNVSFISGLWGKIVYGNIHGWILLDYCKYVGTYTLDGVSADWTNYGISADRLTWVEGCKQEFSYSGGLCTSSATATLLRRRQAAEGKPVTFTFGDIRTSCGGNPKPDSNGYYESVNFYYEPENGWIHKESNGIVSVYFTVKEEEGYHTHNQEYIADLLDVHPEGVVMYAAYYGGGRHSIVISDYVRRSDGSIQFYAYDPVNNGARTKLEDTWMLTKYGSVSEYFNSMMSIWYVRGSLIVDNSKFPHPEARTISQNMIVTKTDTPIYDKADKSSNVLNRLEKAAVIHVSYYVYDGAGEKWYITDDNAYIQRSRVKATDLPVTVVDPTLIMTGETYELAE